jgi:hypothetical protein
VASASRARLDALLARFCSAHGLPETRLNDAGYTEVATARSRVRINLIEPHDTVLLLAPIMPAPERGGAPLYRRLLELSFLATGPAAFAVDKKTDQVFLRAMSPLDALDDAGFEAMMLGVGDGADAHGELLRRQFGT